MLNSLNMKLVVSLLHINMPVDGGGKLKNVPMVHQNFVRVCESEPEL